MLTWDDVTVVVKCLKNVRQKEVAELTTQLNQQGIQYTTCEGLIGEPPRNNFRRLLQIGIDSGRAITMHMEDDAYLAPDFSEKAISYISSEIATFWTFYSSRKEDLIAYDSGKHYRRITPSQYYNSQAVCWPTFLNKLMLEYLPIWESEKVRGKSDVDVFLGSFARKNRLTILASIPSIVQHREIQSTLGHRARYGRVSRTFLKHYGASPDVDSKHQAHAPRS